MQHIINFLLFLTLIGCTTSSTVDHAKTSTLLRLPNEATRAEQETATLDDDSVNNDVDLFTNNSQPQLDSRNENKIIGIYDNATAAPVANFIRRAEKTVDIEIYEMNDSDVRQALREAIKKNVVIRIVKDPSPVGKSCKLWMSPKDSEDDDCTDLRKLKVEIENAGGSIIPFEKNILCGQKSKTEYCYQHGKIILIDRVLASRAALISTGNFNPTNLCDLNEDPTKCNRDFSYISRDREVIATLSTVFESDFNQKRMDIETLVRSGKVNKKLTISPYSLEPIVNFINSAKSKIQIQTQYLKYKKFTDALIAAKEANKSLKIEVQIAEPCNYGSMSEDDASNYADLFTKFDSVGISLALFGKSHKVHGKPGYLHSKVIIIDGKKAWIGSTNISETSFLHNREFGIFFSNKNRVSAFSSFLTEDFNADLNTTWKSSLSNCKKRKEKSKKKSQDD